MENATVSEVYHPPHQLRCAACLWAACVGCAPSPLAQALPGHESSWAAVACQDLPDPLVLRAPEAMGPDPLLPGYPDYLDWLQASPNRAEREQRVQTEIDDLAVFEGTLYAGLGDWGFNTGSLYCYERGGRCPVEDSPGHGMPLLSWAPGETEPTATILEEEEIQRFRRTGAALLVMGTDPTRGDAAPTCASPDAVVLCPEEQGREHPRFARGNVHRIHSGASAVESTAPLASALHVFDMAPLDGVWWAVGSADPGRAVGDTSPYSSHAAVWRSDDDGERWTLHWTDPAAVGIRRLDSLLPLGDRLLMLGHHNRSDGESVSLRYEIRDGVVSEADGLLPELSGVLRTDVLDDETGLAWSHQSSTVSAVSADGASWPLDLGMTLVDTWLLCSGDLLLLGIERSGFTARDAVVYHTHDLLDFTEVYRWPLAMEGRPTSLAWWDGGLVIGTNNDHLLYAAPQGR